MKNYLDDLLVWVIIIAILIPIFIALFRRKRLFIFIVGLLILALAFPATFMLELSINGCCGSSRTGFEGVGYLIGAILAIVGILVMVISKKLSK